MGSPRERVRPADSSNGWLEETFCSLLLESPANTLEDFKAQPIFGRPVMGVVDASAGIFEVFRRVVSPRHIQPADLLQTLWPHLDGEASVKVVSWALPFSREIRVSNRGQEWPSEVYSAARNNGAALIDQTLILITRILWARGCAAAAPAQTEGYDAFRSPEHTFSSSWSERHVAYAAGLGQFGLNGCLMTVLGTNVRFASLVTSLPLEVTVERRPDYRAPCLEDGGESCGLCLERCPVKAISRNGLDKSKCFDRRLTIREKFLATYSQELHLLPSPIVKNGRRKSGFSLGCALCMSAVPCESAPFNETKVTR